MNVIFHFEWLWYFTDVCLYTIFMADSFRKSWHIWLTWLSSCHHQEESLEQIIIDYYNAYRLPQGITCSSRQRVKVWLVSMLACFSIDSHLKVAIFILFSAQILWSTSPHKAHQSWCYVCPSKKKKRSFFFNFSFFFTVCKGRCFSLTLTYSRESVVMIRPDTITRHQTINKDTSLRNGMYWDQDRTVDSIDARLQNKSFKQKPSCCFCRCIYQK